MRAISLWQPWASAIALGAKRIETRSWSTTYRGPIAIHAAKRKRVHELVYLMQTPCFVEALRPLYAISPNSRWIDAIELMPYGAIVATAMLADCLTVNDALEKLITPLEYELGNFEPDRFGWVLEDVKALARPIPFKGKQGFFNVPDDCFTEAA